MNQLFLFDNKKQQRELGWDWVGGGGGGSTEVPTYCKNLRGGQDIFKSKYYLGGTKKNNGIFWWGEVKLLGIMTSCLRPHSF